jgi:hypothetical protein
MSRMKTVALVAVLSLVLLRCVTANAGGIQIRLLTDDDLTNWNCGAPLPSASAQAKPECGLAKYGETSSCPSVAITNDSADEVKVELQVSGSGFEQPPNRWAAMYSFGGPPCNRRDIDRCSDGLTPGHSCYQNIDFAPRDSGVSTGHIEVRVTGSGEAITRSYDISAVAEYPPELAAADQVRKAHLDELMRISHVARVSLDDSDDDIAIDVEVAHDGDIAKVERQVPPRLDGYRVEVTRKIEEGWDY